MRYTLVTLLALGASAAIASAAVSVGVRNFDIGDSAIPITDNAGNGVAGSWGVGIYSGGGLTGAGDVLSSFNQNGSDGGDFLTFLGFLNNTVDDAATAVPPDTSPFIGQPIDVVIGNDPAGLGASSDFIVFRSSVVWPEEVQLLGAAVAIALHQDSSIVRGIPTTFQGGTGPFAGFNGGPGVTFGVIPEPSVSLLAGLAGLGLLVRRRR